MSNSTNSEHTLSTRWYVDIWADIAEVSQTSQSATRTNHAVILELTQSRFLFSSKSLRFKQAHKLQEAQTVKLTSLRADKLKSWQAEKRVKQSNPTPLWGHRLPVKLKALALSARRLDKWGKSSSSVNMHISSKLVWTIHGMITAIFPFFIVFAL